MRLYIYVLTAMLLFTGCGTMKLKTASQTPPQLIEQVPLPSPSFFAKGNELDLKLLIGSDGTVRQVEFQRPTGDEEWERLATQNILKWKFAPALLNNQPIQAWVDQKVKIQFRDPAYLNLAVIVCDSREQADAIYAKLSAGENFNSLAKNLAISKSPDLFGNPGVVDIRRYPEQIQEALIGLKIEKFTTPLALGRSYVIFKRLNDKGAGEKNTLLM